MSKAILVLPDRVLVPYLHGEGHLVITSGDRLSQVFSHVESDTGLQRHYDVAKLTKFAAEHFDQITPGRVPFTAKDIAFIRNHSGVEQSRLDRLTPEELKVPGIIIHLEDNTDIIVDGNHRAVRRFELGFEWMDFCIISEAQAKPALLAIPDGSGFALAMAGRKEAEGV